MKLTERLCANSAQVGECIEWQGSLVNGYGRIKVDGKVKMAHRVAMELALGRSLDRSIDVCHKCDNRKCINVSHLFLGTRKDNMRDCSSKKRLAAQKGKHCPRILTEKDSERVAKVLAETKSQRKAARLLGVSQASVWLFLKRYTK